MHNEESEPMFYGYEQAEINAIERDLEIISAESNVLQFDMDSPADVVRYESKLKYIEDFLGRTTEIRTTSKNGGIHIHLIFTGNLSILERILIQACLGSDRNRELYSFLRYRTSSRPGKEILLFERPEEAIRVRAAYIDSQKISFDEVPF